MPENLAKEGEGMYAKVITDETFVPTLPCSSRGASRGQCPRLEAIVPNATRNWNFWFRHPETNTPPRKKPGGSPIQSPFAPSAALLSD